MWPFRGAVASLVVIQKVSLHIVVLCLSTALRISHWWLPNICYPLWATGWQSLIFIFSPVDSSRLRERGVRCTLFEMWCFHGHSETVLKAANVFGICHGVEMGAGDNAELLFHSCFEFLFAVVTCSNGDMKNYLTRQKTDRRCVG